MTVVRDKTGKFLNIFKESKSRLFQNIYLWISNTWSIHISTMTWQSKNVQGISFLAFLPKKSTELAFFITKIEDKAAKSKEKK